MPLSTTFLVEIDGSGAACGRRAAAHLRPRRRQPAPARPLRAAFPRPRAHRARQDRRQDRFHGQGRGADRRTARRPRPLIEGEVTALEAEFDAGGHVHRHPRLRRRPPPLPRPPHGGYTQMTASDVVDQGGPAGRACRVGTVDATGDGLRAREPAGHDRLGVPGVAVPGDRVRGGRSRRRPLVRQAADRRRRPGRVGRERDRTRWCCGWAPTSCASAPSSPPRSRSKEVEVRGWDVAAKQALTATAPAPTTQRRAAQTSHRRAWPTTFGDPRFVSTDVPYRNAVRGRRPPRRRWRTSSPGRSPSSRASPAATRALRGRRRLTSTGLGAPVRRQVHRHHLPAPLRPGDGYTTSFAVTGRQDRSLLGLTSSGRRRANGRAASWWRRSATSATPSSSGRVKADASPGSPTTTSATGHAPCSRGRQGPRLDGAARGRRRGAGRLRAGRRRAGRTCSAASTTASTRPPPTDRTSSTAAPVRSTGARWSRGAATGSTSSTRRARTRASRLTTGDDKLSPRLDARRHHDHRARDGNVLIEGTQGIVVDAASARPGAQGRRRSPSRRSNGVDRRRWRRAVSVKTSGQLASTVPPPSSRAAAPPRSRAARCAPSPPPWSRSTRRRAGHATSSTGRRPDRAPGRDRSCPGSRRCSSAGLPAATVGTPHICSFPPPAVHPADGDRPARVPDRAHRRAAGGADGRPGGVRRADRHGRPDRADRRLSERHRERRLRRGGLGLPAGHRRHRRHRAGRATTGRSRRRSG